MGDNIKNEGFFGKVQLLDHLYYAWRPVSTHFTEQNRLLKRPKKAVIQNLKAQTHL